MPLIFPPFRPIYPYQNPKYFSSYKKVENTLNHFQNKEDKEDKEDEKAKAKEKEENNRVSPIKDTPINSILSIFPTSIGPLNFNPNAFTNNNEPIFEMFGIHLYLDDIIIICILIFLYQEEVNDQLLYITLFMLLLPN